MKAQQEHLIEEYKLAIEAWEADSREAELWDKTVADGLETEAWD